MEIKYKNKKTEKICDDFSLAQKKYSTRVARELLKLITFIEGAPNFDSVKNNPRYNFHRLKGKSEGLYSLDIGGRRSNYRLIISFEGFNNEIIFNQAKSINILTIEEVKKHDDHR